MWSEYALALAVTIGLETPVVAAVFPGRRVRMGLVCIAATTATHAVMHFALPRICPTFTSWVLAGEAQALVLEALAYWFFGKPRDPGRALIASALANSASYAAGLLIFGQ
jgi:hypothetical protein